MGVRHLDESRIKTACQGLSTSFAGTLIYLAHLLVRGRGQLFHAHVGIDDDAPILNYSASRKDMDHPCWRGSRNRLITD